MFDIGLFKRNAKVPLKYTYWTAFGVCLLSGIISGMFSSGGSNPAANSAGAGIGLSLINPFVFLVFLLSLLTVLSFSLFAIAFDLFLINPIKVGVSSFFMKNRIAPAQFTDMFYSFKTSYINIVKVSGMQYLFIFLWSLLLVIPGIVKGYAYFCVPYILAENPDLEWRQALSISERMTSGYKANLFVLDLSFIGWYILGSLALGVGIAFVWPYHEATKAEAFEAIKQNYININMNHPNY